MFLFTNVIQGKNSSRILILHIILTRVRDLSEISRGEGGGGGNFKIGFGNEVTNPCNASEIC